MKHDQPVESSEESCGQGNWARPFKRPRVGSTGEFRLDLLCPSKYPSKDLAHVIEG